PASGNPTSSVPASSSEAHHRIEPACGACHAKFEGTPNQGCLACHAAALAEDSHPASTFDDPRWAATVASFDVRRCDTCHKEHQAEASAVTVSRDFCMRCHDDVLSNRASHRDFARESCLDAGCHDFHDNRTLNQSALRQEARRK